MGMQDINPSLANQLGAFIDPLWIEPFALGEENRFESAPS